MRVSSVAECILVFQVRDILSKAYLEFCLTKEYRKCSDYKAYLEFCLTKDEGIT